MNKEIDVVVTDDEIQTVELLAESIIKISEAAEKFLSSGLTMKAIILLIMIVTGKPIKLKK